MKQTRTLALTVFANLLVLTALVSAEEPFHVYAPSSGTKQLWVIAAKPSLTGIELSAVSKVDLGINALSRLSRSTSVSLISPPIGSGQINDNARSAASQIASGFLAAFDSPKWSTSFFVNDTVPKSLNS